MAALNTDVQKSGNRVFPLHRVDRRMGHDRRLAEKSAWDATFARPETDSMAAVTLIHCSEVLATTCSTEALGQI